MWGSKFRSSARPKMLQAAELSLQTPLFFPLYFVYKISADMGVILSSQFLSGFCCGFLRELNELFVFKMIDCPLCSFTEGLNPVEIIVYIQWISKGIKWKLTWTYRSFFSDRFQRGKAKGSESRRYQNWGQKVSHKCVLWQTSLLGNSILHTVCRGTVEQSHQKANMDYIG